MDTQIASRKRRILALLIDVWFYGYLTSLSMYLVFFVFKMPWDRPIIHDSISLHFAIWLSGFLIFASKDSFKGLGLGKLVMGIRVYNAASQPAGYIATLIRNLPLLAWPIETLVMILNSNKRRLGDYLADTQVRQDSKIKPSNRGLAILFLISFYGLTPSLPDIDFSEQGLMELSQFIVKQSHAYELAEQKILEQDAIIELIGPIQSIDVQHSSNISIYNDEGEAEFILDVQGESGQLPVMVKLKRTDGQWQLIQMHYEKIQDVPVQ